MNDTEPDFVNELGVKWWLHESLTKYAGKPLRTLPRLDDAIVYITEQPDGYKTFVLVLQGGVMREDQSLEGMAYKIDALRFGAN
jgi:hypothetical protein